MSECHLPNCLHFELLRLVGAQRLIIWQHNDGLPFIHGKTNVVNTNGKKEVLNSEAKIGLPNLNASFCSIAVQSFSSTNLTAYKICDGNLSNEQL